MSTAEQERDAIAKLMEGRIVGMDGTLRPLVDRVRTMIALVSACAATECHGQCDVERLDTFTEAEARAETAEAALSQATVNNNNNNHNSAIERADRWLRGIDGIREPSKGVIEDLRAALAHCQQEKASRTIMNREETPQSPVNAPLDRSVEPAPYDRLSRADAIHELRNIHSILGTLVPALMLEESGAGVEAPYGTRALHLRVMRIVTDLMDAAEDTRKRAETAEAALADLHTAIRNFCSQCGQTYDDPACGIAHIALQSLRQQVGLQAALAQAEQEAFEAGFMADRDKTTDKYEFIEPDDVDRRLMAKALAAYRLLRAGGHEKKERSGS